MYPSFGLTLIQKLFLLERQYATAPPEVRLRRRQQEAKQVVDDFFAFCDEESLKVLDETPISKAIGYARNQRVALQRFLEDGRLPIHNRYAGRPWADATGFSSATTKARGQCHPRLSPRELRNARARATWLLS